MHPPLPALHSAASLLPANATALERALAHSVDPWARLGAPAAAVADYKRSPGEALLPWLVWEYALGELLPWVSDQRLLLAHGLHWQRTRGTAAAVQQAIAWVSDAPVQVQAEEPHSWRWSEYQLDPGRVIESEAELRAIVALARLSAPVRSRLSRIFHGHDLRRLRLSHSALGAALLSDHSGSHWSVFEGAQQHSLRLSFGRWRASALARSSAALAWGRQAQHLALARYDDIARLSYLRLGQRSLPNPEFEVLSLNEWQLACRALGLAALQPLRRWVRSQIALSDSGAQLGCLHARTPLRVWEPGAGAVARLSQLRLSSPDAPPGGWRALAYVQARQHEHSATLAWQQAQQRRSLVRAHASTSASTSGAPERARSAQHSHSGAWRGQRWAGAPWRGAQSWAQTRELVHSQRLSA